MPQADSSLSLMPVGEDLTYVVKFAFWRLGEVKLKIVGEEFINGKRVLKAMAFMDSYEGLPFVTLHQVYESYIDSTFFPVLFTGIMYRQDTTYVTYSFSDDSLINIKKGYVNNNTVFFDSTAKVDNKYQDGLSIVYYSRYNFGKDTTLHIPSFVNERMETTTINFHTETEPVSIEAVEYEIDCLKLDGYTDFVSVYGLTGEFEGWFSNDKYCVPIIAKMNVIIGSVTLELKNWNSELWNPPRYIN